MEDTPEILERHWFIGNVGSVLQRRAGVASYRGIRVTYDNNDRWIISQTDYRPLHDDLYEKILDMLYVAAFTVRTPQGEVVLDLDLRNSHDHDADMHLAAERLASFRDNVPEWLQQGYIFRSVPDDKIAEELSGINAQGKYRAGGYFRKTYAADNVGDALLYANLLLMDIERDDTYSLLSQYKQQVLNAQKILKSYYPGVLADLIFEYI